jgi:hydrogenase maturation protease
MKSALIVGLGSSHGDDLAGWLVIDRLRALGASADQARCAAHPAELWDWCEPDAALVVCDAFEAVKDEGTIQHWQWPNDSLAVFGSVGTHALSLAEALEVWQTLGHCPRQVDVWGIGGVSFEPLATASPRVYQAANQLAETLWQEWFHA